MNIAGTARDDEPTTLAEMEARFCKRCSRELIWRDDEQVYGLFCPACAWEPPPKKEKEPKQHIEKQEWSSEL